MTENSATGPAPLAVVTGASTGIGRAMADELVERGYDVVIVADEPAIEEAGQQLSGRGREVVAVRADLAGAAGVEQVHKRVRATGRTPDALLLNAGVGVGGRFDLTALEDQLRLVDLNVRSTVHLARLVVGDMVAAGHGRVLVTSSIAAVAPGPYHSTYAASKAFVHSFAEGIREELKDTGVTVTSLMPGPTDTEFFTRADMEDTPIGQMKGKDDPAVVAREGIDAMEAGKPSVVAGSVKNKLQAEAGTHMPDALAAPLFARATKPQDRPD